MLNYHIAPSILNADLSCIADQVAAVERGGAKLLHLDIMDGHFVPNLSFGAPIATSLKKCTSLLIDCHLMVNNPEERIPEFLAAGVDSISFHIESTVHPDRCMRMIKAGGAKAAVSLNPATPLSSIEYLLPELDMVLLMSINPGYGGQSFLPYIFEKIKTLRAMAPYIDIQVDGGIKPDNIQDVKAAGANSFVVGTAIYGQGNPELACQTIVKLIEN